MIPILITTLINRSKAPGAVTTQAVEKKKRTRKKTAAVKVKKTRKPKP